MTPHIELTLFSGQFKESFASTGISPEIITLLTWVLGCTAFILCSGIVFHLIQHKRHPRTHIDCIDDTKKIINILGTCLSDRSRFELTFRGKIIQGQGIFCSLISIDAQEILLELPAYVTPRATWIARPIEAYFSIASTTKAPTYYTFESSVLAIDPKNHQGITAMRIALPKTIRLGQRRMHFRLVPPPELIPEIRIWFFPHESRVHHHQGPALWGKSIAEFNNNAVTEGTINSIHLKDISAGGCRLAILDDGRSNQYLRKEKSPDVFIYMNLIRPEGNALRLYLLGKIRVLFRDPTSKEISLGIQFIMNGIVDNETQKNIIWQPIPLDEGLSEVGNWVFKQHVALFRQEESLEDKDDL